MGKNKQAQRTKNNTRPSSSARSAELLETASLRDTLPLISGLGVSGLAISGLAMSVPTPYTLDEFDSTITNNFQICMKKMLKKDATTKIKALQEFATLISTTERDLIKSILNFWPRLYHVLTLDIDHRVREAAHNGLKAIVIQAKRDLAPVLKNLIAPWFISQFDPYAPSASAALIAFQEAFPARKVPEVLVFCQEEILTYIFVNLTSKPNQIANMPQTLSNDKVELVHQRLIGESLNAYALYLNTLSVNQIENAAHLHANIVRNAKFWKLTQLNSVAIRSAWFALLATILKRDNRLLDDEGKHVTTIVMSNIDETDPTVLPAVWEAALLSLFTLQDWWTHINVDKLVLPKLWRVLRGAAHGNASTIFPNLLPLVSKFPPGSDVEAFYTSFFQNMRLGFKQKSVQLSRSELVSIAVTFVECMQYVIVKNQTNRNVWESLVKVELMSLIAWCLSDGQFAAKVVFEQVQMLVASWYRNTCNPDYGIFVDILALFWSCLLDTLMEPFRATNVVEEKLTLMNNHVTFLLTWNRNSGVKRKKLKVQFLEEQPSPEMKSTPDDSTTSNCDDFKTKLNETALTVCRMYFDDMLNTDTDLANLYYLIKEYESKTFLIGLANEPNDPGATSSDDLKLLCVFHKLFERVNRIDVDRVIMVDAIFVLFAHMTDYAREIVLQSFLTVDNDRVLYRAITLCVQIDCELTRRWMTTDRITAQIITLCNQLVTCADVSVSKDALALLNLVTKPNERGDFVIHRDCVESLIRIVQKPLAQTTLYSDNLDACVRFASTLSSNLFTNASLSYNVDLLMEMIRFSLRAKFERYDVTGDTVWEVSAVWQDCLTNLNDLKNENGLLFVNANGSIETIAFDELIANVWRNIRCEIKRRRLSAEEIDGVVGVVFTLVESLESINNIESVSNMLRGLFDVDVSHVGVFVRLIGEHLGIDCSRYTGDVNVDFSQLMVCLTIVLKIRTKILSVNDNDESDEDGDGIIRDGNAQIDVKIDDENGKVDFSAIFSNVTAAKTLDIFRLINHIVRFFIEFHPNEQTYKLKAYYDVYRTTIDDHEEKSIKTLLENLNISVKPEMDLDVIKSQTVASSDWILNPPDNLTTIEIDALIDHATILAEIVATDATYLDLNNWDAVFKIIAVNLTRLHDFRVTDPPQMWALLNVTVSLFVDTVKFFRTLVNNPAAGKGYMRLLEDWNQIVNEEIHVNFLPIYETIFRSGSSPYLRYKTRTLNILSGACECLNIDSFPACRQDWSEFIALFRCGNAHVQTLALTFFRDALANGMIARDRDVVEKVNTDVVSVEKVNVDDMLQVAKWKEAIDECDVVIRATLNGFVPGEDNCQIEPYTDLFTYTRGYLFMWTVILKLCKIGGSELRYYYSQWLRKNDVIKSLLDNVLRLMPEDVLDLKTNGYTYKVNVNDLTGLQTAASMEKYACWLYFAIHLELPALVRLWWSGCETRVARAAEKITVKFLTPKLIGEEVQTVMDSRKRMTNVEIKTLKNGEISAIYRRDDAKTEICISFPPNYPLGVPKLEAKEGISANARWKNIVMMLTLLLTHQDGSICDAINMWKDNLDKLFDGVEECCICFSVLHSGTQKMPKLSCEQCKKRFHSVCLYKWFSTSNKSTCPICRHLF